PVGRTRFPCRGPRFSDERERTPSASRTPRGIRGPRGTRPAPGLQGTGGLPPSDVADQPRRRGSGSHLSPASAGPFHATLKKLGFDFIEVPDGELDTMAPTVRALGPRDCLMLRGNPTP